MLEELVKDHEYVAVFFTGDCNSHSNAKITSECRTAVAELETIDDELEEIGILMVTTEDAQVAADNGTNVIHTFSEREKSLQSSLKPLHLIKATCIKYFLGKTATYPII